MNTMQDNDVNQETVPHALVRDKKGFPIIWIIPLVAVLIGLGLIYKTVTEKGPSITISFNTAEGLEAGKTKIKYKDVEIGRVESIKLNDSFGHVIVKASLVREAGKYLNENTRFYVVKARFAGGVAYGLDTLLSGSYIGIDPGHEGSQKKHFKGLEEPPTITSDQPGRHFILKAEKLNSLQHGSPVYFKGIKVGQVTGYKFAEPSKDLEINIFIEEPYDKTIHDSTRFWVASGLDMVLDANGVRLDSQSLVSMMIGGIAYANPDNTTTMLQAGENHLFPLFNSPEDAMEKTFAIKEYYLLKFDHSVRGLAIGAPVEFQGFPFGQVVDISLEPDWINNTTRIPVKIEVEPERLRQLTTNHKDEPTNALDMLIGMGLRAQLKTGNLISGSKYVAIDFHKTVEPASLIVHDHIVEIPTIPEPLDEMADNFATLLAQLSKIDYKELSVSALKTLDHLQKLTANLENKLPDALSNVSDQATTTLGGIDKLTASDSALVYELKETLKEISRAAQSVRQLADQLERHPESLIQGKGAK